MTAALLFSCEQLGGRTGGFIGWTARANGSENTETSSIIVFTFSEDVADFSANDISITNTRGSAEPIEMLPGVGKEWSLLIMVERAGTVNIVINKAGIEAGPKAVTVHEGAENAKPVRTGITVISPPNITLYALNQPFDRTGLVVAWVHSDGSTEAIPEGAYETDEPDMSKANPKRIYVRAGGYQASFNIQVLNSDKVLTHISAEGPANKTQDLGKEFDRTGLAVTGHFSDGSTQSLTSLAAIFGYDNYRRGPQEVGVKVNGKTALLEGITTRIGEGASVSIYASKKTYIKGEAITPEKAGIKFNVWPGGGALPFTLSLENGRLTPEDFATLAGYNPNQPGTQTISMILDGRNFTLEVYVVDTEPAVWFDYGCWRHAGDPTGHGPGAGKYYARPDETLVIAPVRYLVGYNDDNSDAVVTYSWTVSGNDATRTYTTTKGGELLHITPKIAGTYAISVDITGRSFATGATITKTASADLVCYTGTLPAGTFTPPLKNFGGGQFTEGGAGLGWSLGSAGGYEVWTVNHQASYKIKGNALTGWREAGVVWMQEDKNGNGLPDEMWYELRGSDEDHAKWKDYITRRYAITYFKTDGNGSTNEYGQLIREVYWADSRGRAGIIGGGFPNRWGVVGDWVTFTCTLLRDNGDIVSEVYTSVSSGLDGYVDTYSDTFYVNDAINAAGNPVTLTAVRFIKVQTAIFQYGGIFGDVSTEIKSADFLGQQTDFPDPEDSKPM
jgi:hypothetical protein